MNFRTRAGVVGAALLCAGTISAVHYQIMQPMAGATLRLDGGPSPQERVARVHLVRAVPVVFAVAVGVCLIGTLRATRPSLGSLGVWALLGGLAGAAGFAAAEPLVPLPGPAAGPSYTRQGTLQSLAQAGLVGVVVGGIAGLLVGAAGLASSWVWQHVAGDSNAQSVPPP